MRRLVTVMVLLAVPAFAQGRAASGTCAAGAPMWCSVDGTYSGASAGVEGQCLKSGGTAAPTWGDCSAGGGAPADATYITQTCNASLSNEQCMSALGTGIVISTTTTGVQSIYAGSACGANTVARSTSASGVLTCSAIDLGSADVTGSLPGGNVSGAVATATALANNPTDCGADQYATSIAANGNLTCGGITGGQVTGAVATATALASNPTDCAGGQYATAIAANGDLTCATPAGGGDPWTRVVTTGDITDNTLANATNITGLSWAVSAATNYRARCYMVTDAAAATTGVRVGVTGPASPTQLTWTRDSCASAVAARHASFTSYTADGTTASAGTTRCVDVVDFILLNGVNAGTIQWTLGTEIDTSQVAVRIGSWCEYMTF